MLISPLEKELSKTALWLVMHPCQSMNKEQEILYPWRAAGVSTTSSEDRMVSSWSKPQSQSSS